MQISIIGAGNVATHLALSLHLKGVQINSIVSRNIRNAEILAIQVGAKAFSNMKKDESWEENDFVIVAVKDDAIESILESNLLLKSNVVHTSGSYDSDRMKIYCKSYGAFYPFQTFRKTAQVNIAEVPFFLEFSDEKLKVKLFELAHILSPNVFELNSESRKKIHVSGVFINNFIYFILNKMKKFGNEHQIDAKHFLPLLQQTIDNAMNYSENLQTGPAVRGDLQTMKSHIEILQDDAVLQNLYRTLSSMIYQENNGKEIEL
jgi:predicted short-subunit dehydrogenase-like oxidoreductase (DUF2520 family)